MSPTPDDTTGLNPLTESVPVDVLTLSDDLGVGLDHPATDNGLDALEELPGFFDDLYELLRAYKRFTEGDTSRPPYEDTLEGFLDTWEDTPLITSPE